MNLYFIGACLFICAYHIGKKLKDIFFELKKIKKTLSIIEVLIGSQDPEDYAKIKRLFSEKNEREE